MYNIEQEELITSISQELKTKITMPEWAGFVKTGVHKERPPVDNDWWYIRAASILRQVYLKEPIGVSKLRFKYGSKKRNRGMKPEHFYKGSGKIIRTILQQMESAKLIAQEQKGVHKGRVLTPTGKSLVFQTAKKLETSKPKPVPKPVEKVEQKPQKAPEVKPEIKPETKVEAKQETKPETKTEISKPEQDPKQPEIKENKE